jgi:epidermal growth factor receptor substrate 15
LDRAVSPQDKAHFDSIFDQLDMGNTGQITPERAVSFFSNSRLPDDVLAWIWDFADINANGFLNRDEFAVAMRLIRQERSKCVGIGDLRSA